MKLLIGVPHQGSILTPCVKSLMALDLSDFKERVVQFEQGSLLHFQRNNIVRRALECGADYVLFIDSDVEFSPDAVKKLLAAGKDVVSGVYFSKNPPFMPVIYSDKGKGYVPMLDYPENRVFEVASCGAGCMLVKTSVFRVLSEPYFAFSESKVESGQPMSEDMYFCEKARKAGFKVYCDSSVKCAHYGYQPVTENAFKQLKDRIKLSDDLK